MQPILKVDLSTGEREAVDVPAAWMAQYVGGASLAARYLYEHMTPDLDPLGAAAPLLFLTGPLTGTAGPSVGRFVIAGKSPATGLWGESNCGGFWGPELRKAGFFGLFISGQAERLVYLWIRDGNVEIRPADHLAGLDTYVTQDRVVAELGGGRIRVASIGPAGENLVPYALILCDHGRVAGRTGLGAVMGAKNLKAVAVRGHGIVPVHDPQIYAEIRGQANRNLRNDSYVDLLRSFGSAGGSDYFDYLGEMPKKYFQKGEYSGASNVSGATVAETIQVGVSTCHGCVIACGRVVRLEDGKKRKGPEYETLVGFGPNLLADDIRKITRIGELCDRYGLDTISTSNTIGFAFTLFERGVLPTSDTDGIQLKWGDLAVVERLIPKIAAREGFGATLAEGARALGKRYGSEADAVQVNGLEVAFHDPRGGSGMGLVYATSPRGACHNQSDYFLVEIGQIEDSLGIEYYPRHAGGEKAANVALHQDWRTVCNALVYCFFANVSPPVLLSLINAATGLDWEIPNLLGAGQRAWNLKRVINHRLGLTRAEDRLPEPLMQTLGDGGSVGFQLALPEMLSAYYDARGWDPQSGSPTRKTLEALDLGWAADDLWPEN